MQLLIDKLWLSSNNQKPREHLSSIQYTNKSLSAQREKIKKHFAKGRTPPNWWHSLAIWDCFSSEKKSVDCSGKWAQPCCKKPLDTGPVHISTHFADELSRLAEQQPRGLAFRRLFWKKPFSKVANLIAIWGEVDLEPCFNLFADVYSAVQMCKFRREVIRSFDPSKCSIDDKRVFFIRETEEDKRS